MQNGEDLCDRPGWNTYPKAPVLMGLRQNGIKLRANESTTILRAKKDMNMRQLHFSTPPICPMTRSQKAHAA